MTESLEATVGQVLCVGFPGTTLSPEVAQALRAGQMSGVILMGYNVQHPRQVHRLLQDLAAQTPPGAPPLLLGVDQEGGRVARLKAPLIQLPPARKMGHGGDPDLTQDMYHLLGRQLRALGFTLDFAPVLDVDEGSPATVIGDRSFSGDPQEVARHGVAAIRGLLQAGLCPCGKHFPGHGASATDSHHELPHVDADLDELRQRHLLPFQEAIGIGAPMIMPGHLLIPALDPDRATTVSRQILQRLLRDELGFTGVTVTDDLTMGAVTRLGSPPDVAVEALMAGADLLLICHGEQQQAAVRQRLLSTARRQPSVARRLSEAASRVTSLRRRFPPAPWPIEDLEQLWRDPQCQQLERKMEDRLGS